MGRKRLDEGELRNRAKNKMLEKIKKDFGELIKSGIYYTYDSIKDDVDKQFDQVMGDYGYTKGLEIGLKCAKSHNKAIKNSIKEQIDRL